MRIVQKLRVASIAGALEVSERTVEMDLAAMRRLRTDHFRRSREAAEQALAAAVEVVEECDALCRQAWADLVQATPGSATRAKFLGVALSAMAQRIKILQSLGMLERAPEEVLVGDADLRQLTDDEARRVLELLDSLRGAPAEAGGGAGAAEGAAGGSS